MSVTVSINNLPLPVALVRAIESGVWQAPKNNAVWRSIFPVEEIVQPTLYSLNGMKGETSWLTEAGPAYLGRVAEGIMPGNIDPSRSVLIADLGRDRLIALDYRKSQSRPSVVALTSESHSCWRQIAEDIETLMQAINLME